MQVDRQLTRFGVPLPINAEFRGSCLVIPAEALVKSRGSPGWWHHQQPPERSLPS